MKYLYKLTYEELIDLVENKLKIKKWFIYKQKASDRINQIETKPYFLELSAQAYKNGIKAQPAEKLSWLDTLNLLYYSLKYVNEEILDDLTIIQEYKIPFSNKRADYILVYQNKILIIEFSFDKLGDVYKYENKLNQAMGYKELLSNLLPPHIEVGTYTFILEAEIDENGKEIEKLNKYEHQKELANNEKIQDLGKYISLFFKKEQELALLQLEFLDGYETGATNPNSADDSDTIYFEDMIANDKF